MGRRPVTPTEAVENRPTLPTSVKIILIILILATAILVGTVSGKQLEYQTIENVFIDINGDGLVDYVRKAEVIINNGETNFIPNQSP